MDVILLAADPLWLKLAKYIGLPLLIMAQPFIPWTKVTLGAILAFGGAFFLPKNGGAADEPEAGSIEGKTEKKSFAMKGSLRFLVVLAGIILIAGAVAEGIQKRIYVKAPEVTLHPDEFKEKVKQVLGHDPTEEEIQRVKDILSGEIDPP